MSTDEGHAEIVTVHKIGTRAEWAAARKELLAREKEHTRRGDDLARRRRELPWVPVEKEHRFDTDDGTRTLAELFDGRSQLLVYHFMFGPSYQAGCPTCSSIADGVDGLVPHLNARDVTMLFVSQAPLEKLQTYKRRMGWSLPWVSSAGNEFNLDPVKNDVTINYCDIRDENAVNNLTHKYARRCRSKSVAIIPRRESRSIVRSTSTICPSSRWCRNIAVMA